MAMAQAAAAFIIPKGPQAYNSSLSCSFFLVNLLDEALNYVPPEAPGAIVCREQGLAKAEYRQVRYESRISCANNEQGGKSSRNKILRKEKERPHSYAASEQHRPRAGLR